MHIGRAACWIAVCGVVVGIFTGSPAPASAQAKFITEYRIDRDSIEVPFEYKNHQIFVHGEADGKTNLTFVFDTGASAPVLDKALGLTGPHISDTVIQEAEGKTAAESVWLSQIDLGDKGAGAHVYNIAVLLTDLSQMSRVLGRKIDGVIGISYLAGYVTEIDYIRHVIRLYDPRNYTIADRKPDNQRSFLFSLTPANLNPTKPLSCQMMTGRLHPKYDYNFLIDTGFGGYVSVAQSAGLESGLFKPDMPRITTTSYSVSRQFTSYKIRAGYLAMGEINLSGRIVSVDVRNGDIYGQTGIVGNRFFQNYRFILDYPRKKLWLERVTDKEEPDDSSHVSLGIAVRADGKSLRVERVTKNSPAYVSGIKEGDMILSVNGQPLDKMSTTQALNLLASPRNPTVLALARRVDPNLGTHGETYTLTLEPSSPLDWKTE